MTQTSFDCDAVALKVLLYWCKDVHEYHLIQERGVYFVFALGFEYSRDP